MSNNKDIEINIKENEKNSKHEQQYEVCNESFAYSAQDELDSFYEKLEEEKNKKD